MNRRELIKRAGNSLVAGASVLGGCEKTWNRGADFRPNILFFCLDDIGCPGFDFYPTWGTEKVPPKSLISPRLSAFARDRHTRVFDCMRATPICWSTRVEAMTGRKVWDLGLQMHPTMRARPPVDEIPVHEFVYNRMASYDKGAFGKWHITLPGAPEDPKRFGFDEYGITLDVSDQNTRSRYWGAPWATHEGGSELGQLPADRFVDDEAVDGALNFIEKRRGSPRPWYCQVWLNLNHQPMVDVPGRAGILSANVTEQYRMMLEYADQLFGRIVDRLKSWELFNDTLIIVTSDNGGGIESGGQKGDVSELGIRVPFLIHCPGVVEGGNEHRLAQLTDLAPTLCEAAGAPAHYRHSRSLFPLFAEGTEQIHDYICMTVFRYNWMIADEKWKIKTPPHARTSLEAAQHLKLYDLTRDPYELSEIRRGNYPGKDGKAARVEAAEALSRLTGYAESLEFEKIP